MGIAYRRLEKSIRKSNRKVKNKGLENITKIAFLSLAILPLLRENINSMLIILVSILVIIHVVKTKNFKVFRKEYWVLTSLFWMFLAHEIISFDFNFNRIIRYLPFLIFPLIFYYRPPYIDKKIKQQSIKIFQISVLLQSFIYLVIFLKANSIAQLFYISPEEIPFFREYVYGNYYFKIHPTYFSAYLLVSFTISWFTLLIEKGKNIFLTILNSILTVFFIFLFSSKIIFILLFITIIASIAYLIFKKGIKQQLIPLGISLVVFVALIYPSREIIGNRFKEIKTEINKPIIGDYYNSTNTRVAIFRCSLILVEELPFFGFGEELQEKLNNCYGATNDSEFYKKGVFNTHNYYFNLVLYGGWLFLVLFIIIIYFYYKNSIHSLLGLFLLSQFLLINLTENYFSRHYGIVLFTYFISLFIFIGKSEKFE